MHTVQNMKSAKSSLIYPGNESDKIYCYNFFKNENFDFGQGYYFYHPLTKSEFEKLI